MEPRPPYKSILQSPIGTLEICASDKGINTIKLTQEQGDFLENKHTLAAKTQLHEYFNRKRKTFDVPLDVQGTDFEKKVWDYLVSIPYGRTTNYGTISKEVSTIKAVRAVGRANGKNPVPIIVPCHRVIGSDGSLVGFALGLAVKKHLLRLENPESFGEQLSLGF